MKNSTAINAYLVIYSEGSSEFMKEFNDVQHFMNTLSSNGVKANVRVQKFRDNMLEKEFTYDYDSSLSEWVKRGN